MSRELTRTLAADVTRCCATVYSSELVTLLLGDTWHPGGLDLTHRLGQLAGITSSTRVLDVACGVGTSARALAEQFGCSVIGIDASCRNVALANAHAMRSAARERLRFVTGEASDLPFRSGAFDVALCECSLCTFADQEHAVREIARVLGPQGRIGLSDVTRNGILPPELDTLLGRVACLAGALPADAYAPLLQSAGFVIGTVEQHDDVLHDVIARIRQRIVGAQLITRLHQLDLPGVDLDQAAAIARSAEACIRNGRLGYLLLVGQSSPVIE